MNSPLPASTRLRLDELLVERGLFGSRSRARDAVDRGTVSVDGAVARKPGQFVTPDCLVAVDDPAQAYVSRAALKLIAGLDLFGLDPAGSEALDIGASTGGFTQVLLERGAAHVTAIDVGHGQMHPGIAGNSKVRAIEGLNARDLSAADLDGSIPNFLVCDVSFISLKLALPPALALAAEGARALLLVKPQFEAGREAIGKGGLLKDPTDAERIAAGLRDWLAGIAGWRVLGLHPSPIEGGDGNREFLLAAVKDAVSR
ncbi:MULTISPECIES: TlyA family RNA methyltransferase [unclassified Mesorhizobium]|uniref:TlyA family RNA methyltransferase n=1 Tax=unclassified Mesorhizobium TaxID=325217 RepID=UPI000BB08186|nr:MULTISPECIES: TlyA family RNA methyltransferase [unclassified Mesorhizobium]TGT61461.1 TlyA family RNA methyltransferase [Mesorhizobium sp. M00.F.Ca.ET.170.01.1.1]AZO09232.1 TlyA family RNA methyltransferase [Mesorhizobium sp. M3A.F.Ca.ET.080.04.2.1]PBB87404.1 TlyA family rRNA (cytidine-2'-O)-methyltransferase [Mesorhizobium sp. WSM3876]RWB74227.1 MAG: TlyA family RNA methyltransferase [Mesorhizobium sp.]RWB88432.1 MAG: TlyA family RNA methyltransferase [Mesorhizobium sp.]